MSRVIVKHTLYNAAGLVAPILAAVVAIPILIDALGAARFGILTLVWAIVNYFGIFDLGLGRALTLQLSVLFSGGRWGEVNSLIRTTSAALALLGLAAAGAVLFSRPFIAPRLGASVDVAEIGGTIVAIAAALPFIVLTSGVRGALEAKGAFGILNAIRVPMGVLNFALPVAVALYGSSRLDDIAWTLTLARIVGLALHCLPLIRLFDGVLTSRDFDWKWLRVLIANGGWMTVSNIVSPVMGYLDRFIVGFLLPSAAVAYYATPQELILKMYLIPGALTAVLFPRFAGGEDGLRQLYRRSLLGIGVIVTGACAVGTFGAETVLSMWVGQEFAAQSYRAMQILVLGVFCGAMSSIPYTYLQATGRSNLTAISHVCQVPLFLLCSYLLTATYGIEGAAVAWSLRLAVDALILFGLAHFLPVKRTTG